MRDPFKIEGVTLRPAWSDAKSCREQAVRRSNPCSRVVMGVHPLDPLNIVMIPTTRETTNGHLVWFYFLYKRQRFTDVPACERSAPGGDRFVCADPLP